MKVRSTWRDLTRDLRSHFAHIGSILTSEDVWRQREGRRTRYDGKRVGGTIVVHFIKKSMWFLETALAFLEGDEETGMELERKPQQQMMVPSWLPSNHHVSTKGSSAITPLSAFTSGVGHKRR